MKRKFDALFYGRRQLQQINVLQTSVDDSSNNDPLNLNIYVVLQRMRTGVISRRGELSSPMYPIKSTKRIFQWNINFLNMSSVHKIQPPESQVTSASRRPAKIVELLAEDMFIFSLNSIGILNLYDRETFKYLGNLNVIADNLRQGAIKSMFFNRSNESLIIILVKRDNAGINSLVCKMIAVSDLRLKLFDKAKEIFQEARLEFPAYVELDEVNKRIITHNKKDHLYRFFNMCDYSKVFEILNKVGDPVVAAADNLEGNTTAYHEPDDFREIVDTKITVSRMLLIYKKKVHTNSIPLRIISMKDGKEFARFYLFIPLKNATLEWIEFFEDILLYKVAGLNVGIRNVNNLNKPSLEVKNTSKLNFDSFIFLYSRRKFLSFSGRSMRVWSLSGDCLFSFEDHQLPPKQNASDNASSVFITSDHSAILSYSKPVLHDRNTIGTFNISSLETGRLLAKLRVDHEISSVFYDESTNHLLLGDSNGYITVWAN